MTTSKKKKRSVKRGATEAEAKLSSDALFKSAQPKSTTARPRMKKVFEELVEKTFSLEDPIGLYEELEEALNQRKGGLTPGVLRELLADSPRLYREAHKLYVTARADFERYEFEYAAFESSMREEARRELEREKQLGLRSKAPTIREIDDRMASMYPDAVEDIKARNVMARKTVEDLKHLVDVFKARGFALKALVGGREEL